MPESSEPRLHVRRARRTDFVAVMRLCAAAAPFAAMPLPDRATLRRFRQLVNDLGGDFYLGFFAGELAGLVHATYARRLAEQPMARVEELIVAPEWRRRGVGSRLLALVVRRARKRGCATIACTPTSDSQGVAAFLAAAGLRPTLRGFSVSLFSRDDSPPA